MVLPEHTADRWRKRALRAEAPQRADAIGAVRPRSGLRMLRSESASDRHLRIQAASLRNSRLLSERDNHVPETVWPAYHPKASPSGPAYREARQRPDELGEIRVTLRVSCPDTHRMWRGQGGVPAASTRA